MDDVSPGLSLDFANRTGWSAVADPGERLATYGAALDWAVEKGLLDEEQACGLRALARNRPDDLEEALNRAAALRRATYRLFVAAARSRPSDPADLQRLNAELAEAMAHLRLSPGRPDGDGPRFHWTWAGMENDLTSMLWPVVRAAAALLTSPLLARVRDCANEECGWLFIDQSKNASRRWCDMGECGNRAKARRFRERKRSESRT